MDKLNEDILYYSSSPETLLNYKKSIDEESNYEFYKDLDCENFLTSQKERNKIISSISNLNYDSLIKQNKLSNYNSFYSKNSFIDKTNYNESKIINSNLIRKKLDEYSFLYLKETDENKLLSYLNELKNLFQKHKIDMQSLGLTHFNYIENYLCLILNLIISKFTEINNNNNKFGYFLTICIEILECIKSSNLYFFILKYMKENQKILESENFEDIKEKIQFMPNNIFNFSQIDKYVNKNLVTNLKKFIKDKNILESIDLDLLDLNDYWTLNYNDFLFIFIKSSKNNFLLFLKFNLIEEKIINNGKILLLDNFEENYKKIIDINLTIKNEFIYIFYLIEKSINNASYYSLIHQIYNQNTMHLINKNEIDFEKSFIPTNLINDYKYLYCFSKNNQVFMVKKNYKLNDKKYINCFVRLYNKDLKFSKESNLEKFKMYNSLCINNLFIVDNLQDKKKYIGKFVDNKNNNYIINLYEFDIDNYDNLNQQSIMKITYNDNRFIATVLDKNSNGLFFNMTSKDFNIFIDKGILLLPFATNDYNKDFSQNIYEYLLHQYSSFVNICGNFDLINTKTEEYLTKFPFSFCCNFELNNLDFIINCIIENDIYDNKKYYYIIILKQMICSLYNAQIFDEEKIKNLLPYLKKLIMNNIKINQNKLFNKILKEIIIISSYINNNTIIEINDIKFVLDNNYEQINFKTKLLIIELLLQQNKTQNQKELFNHIINLEKKYLINIFKNKANDEKKDIFDLSFYSLSKKLMINASEILFKKFCSPKNDLSYLIPDLSNIIQEICELYSKLLNNKNDNSSINKFSFIYNSFTFRTFYFIIEKLIANRILLKEQEKIYSLYKTILILDKININNKQYQYYDMNNVIEITNYSLLDIELEGNFCQNINLKLPIKIKEPKNLIIKTNISSNKELDDSFDIQLLNNNNESYKVDFFQDYDNIYHNIKEIKIIFKTKTKNIVKKDFILNFIPLKNEEEYNLYKNNEDYKIISLIQKTIIYYLIFLYEDIHKQINNYHNNKIIKNHSKLYQTEIFKFMSISEFEPKKIDLNSISPFIEITNKLIEEINVMLCCNKNNFNKLNEDLIISFSKINKEINPKQLEFLKSYENKIKSINKISSKKQPIINGIDENKIDKLFYFFKYILSKKNILLNQIKENENIDSLISKIFFFAIKYYNSYDKLNTLLKEIEIFKKEEIQENLYKIQSIKNFSLFYSFYETSSKIKLIYHKHKSSFIESEFVKAEKKYFDENNKKIEFLYNIIVPCDDSNIQPNISIINNILDLVENKDIELDEIKQFSFIQNISCQVKLIELIIINNLILSLSSENNIIYLLNLICRKIRQANNKLNSFFDNTYGADYYIMEKLKYQFHMLLHILSYKNINGKNQYSLATQISLTENLMWKIRGRNFPVLFEIMKVFEPIKTVNKNNINNGIFIFEHENIYNVKYFNERKSLDIKFEIFKILVYQIISKIKNILENNDKDNNQLLLERNPSTISDIDYKAILNNIISYFVDIEPECLYYNELILFFYNIFINSKIILNFILTTYPNVISKIMKLVFNIEVINNKKVGKISKSSRIIMINLLSQILENIKENDLEDLSECIQLFEKKNDLNIENPFIYLYEKVMEELSKKNENNNIYKYYNKLLLICLNKILEFDNNKDILAKIINKIELKNIIFLLFSDKCSNICGNRFMLKIPYIYKFEDEALFSSKNQEIKTGKIISFFIYNNNNPTSFEELWKISGYKITKIQSMSKYLLDNFINYFEKDLFKYQKNNKSNKDEEILVIMDDITESEYYKITSSELKNFSEITIIKDDNCYQELFIKNNSKILIKIIRDNIVKNNLNEKGICFLLKIISKLINFLNKEDILTILKYIWNYYEKNKQEENKYIFMSLELIEDIMDKYFDFNNQSYLNIYQEIINEEKSIFDLFNFIIKGDSIGINLKTNNNIKWFKKCLKNPINNINENIKNIYDNTIKLSNISFYKCHKIYTKELIKDNSVLFTNSINNSNDLLDLSKIIEQNNNKIKVIIVNEINETLVQSNLIEFIYKNLIPIYKLEKKIYNIFISFFIEGNGANYINLKSLYEQNNNKENKTKEENNIIDIYKFDFNIESSSNNNNTFFESKGDNEKKLKIFEKNRNKIYNDLMNETNKIYKLLNIKLIKRLIYDLISLDNITFSEIKNIFNNNIKNIVYIYEVICMEYYFNIQHNISNIFLKQKMQNYLLKLLFKEKKMDIDISSNEWLISFINDYMKNFYKKFSDYKEYLTNFNLSNYNLKNEDKLMTDYLNSYDNVVYDILIFISKKFNLIKNKEYLIKIFINLFKKIIQNIKLRNDRVISKGWADYGKIDRDYFSPFFLYEIFNILYDYYFDNNIKINNKLFEYFISDKIDWTLEDFIKTYIDLDIFFNNNNKKENLFTQKISYLIQYIFKYFDFCLILFLKENKKKLFEYWVESKCKLFTFYCDYKILSIEKNYKGKDIKEIISLVAYLIDIISYNSKGIKDSENVINTNFKMKINQFNEYKINNKDLNNLIIKFNNFDENKEQYNKLAVFTSKNLNNNKQNDYILQDIIDINDIKRKNCNSYELKINQDIHFVPLKNVSTFLYSFEHDPIIIKDNVSTFSSISLGISQYKNFRKNENIPKYCWNVGYFGTKFLLLTEDNNQIYNKEEINNNISLFKEEEVFTLEEKINEFNIKQNEKNNKIIDFINGPSEMSSFLLTKNGEIYCLEKEKEKKAIYSWLKDIHIYSKEFPLKIEIIPDLKIKYMSFTYNECYIIDNYGNLYGNRNQVAALGNVNMISIQWVNIPLPSNNKKFLQCASGEDHFLCLIEDNKGKRQLYAKGYNDYCQCAITNKNNNPTISFLDLMMGNPIINNDVYINNLTKSDKLEDIEFKSIYAHNFFSAGITTSGYLYVWGIKDKNEINNNFEKPCLVKSESKSPIFVDQIVLKGNKLFAIGRILENRNYIKKLFSLEKNINQDKELGNYFLHEIKEIKLEDKDSRIIPVKICIGNKSTYVLCVNGNNLIKEIEENNIKNNIKKNDECEISINNSIIVQKKEDNDIEKIKAFYSSENLAKFINKINSLIFLFDKELILLINLSKFSEE